MLQQESTENGLIDSVRSLGKYVFLNSIGVESCFDNFDYGVIIANQSGDIIYSNPAIVHIFGYSRHELLNHKIEVLVPDEVKSQHVHDRDHFIAHPAIRPMAQRKTIMGRHKNGGQIPVMISLFYMSTPQGILPSACVRMIEE